MPETNFEDPYEQLFYESLTQMMDIGRDSKVDASIRVTALNEVQKSFLSKTTMERAVDMTDKQSRTLNRAIDQVKRLHDGS